MRTRLCHKDQGGVHQAAEIACGNVPELPGPVLIGLDTSGSMGGAVTGHRGRGATSKMRCVDVAALFAAAILRRNPDSVVVPFDTAAYEAKVDPQDTILSLAERLAKYGGGGTDCSLPLVQANGKYAKWRFAGVVLVSDNESWVYAGRAFGYGQQAGRRDEGVAEVCNKREPNPASGRTRILPPVQVLLVNLPSCLCENSNSTRTTRPETNSRRSSGPAASSVSRSRRSASRAASTSWSCSAAERVSVRPTASSCRCSWSRSCRSLSSLAYSFGTIASGAVKTRSAPWSICLSSASIRFRSCR